MKQMWTLVVAAALPALAWAGPVNINTADAATMADELVGVGLKKAQAIVEFRNEHGAFESAEELLQVKGIGDRVLADNSGNIRVSD